MKHVRAFLPALFALASALTGCASLPHSAPLPAGVSVRKVAAADAASPFAISPEGKTLVFVKKELKSISLSDGTGRSVAPAPAIALSFSPDGRLAAAFRTGARSTLCLYHRSGEEMARTQVDGTVTALTWRGNAEVVATAMSLTRFSFGSNLSLALYRWDGKKNPLAAEIYNTTIRKSVAALPEAALLRSTALAISPYGDEIAYTRLKDPPAFNPYLQVIIRHLDSGAERPAGDASFLSGGPVFAADGERMLLGDGEATTRWTTIANGREGAILPVAGRQVAASASGNHLLLDGHLFEKSAEIALFPAGTAGAFSTDGTSLALRHDGALYLLTGLQDAAPAPLAPDQRLLELRRMRSQGLLSEKDLQKAQKAASP